MYVLAELGYVLVCQVKEKRKKCSFEIALVEKSESSNRNKRNDLAKRFYFILFLNLNLSSSRDCLTACVSVLTAQSFKPKGGVDIHFRKYSCYIQQ